MAKKPGGIARVVVAVVVGVCLVIAGAVAAVAVLWDDPPDLLSASATDATSVAVTQRDFDDAQTVGFAVSFGQARALVAPTSGVVTSFACDPGRDAVSGQSVVAVDGAPLVSLATAEPLWRDIAWGDAGADVVAMAAELARLGRFNGDVSAKAGSTLLAAYRGLAADLGVPTAQLPKDVIPLSGVVWLPQPEIGIASCDALVGSRITAGQTMVTFIGPVVRAHVTADLSGMTPGARAVVLGDQRFTVDQNGAITDPADLAAVADNPVVRNATSSSQLNSIKAAYVLVDPINVSVVPPAAIRPRGNSTGCVIGDGAALPVTIVASQLGQSLVTFAVSPPASV